MSTFSNTNGWKAVADKLNEVMDQASGTVSGTGVAVEITPVAPQRALFPFTDVSVATTDNTTSGASGSLKFYTFPAGNVVILSAVTDLSIAKEGSGITSNAAVVGAIGTVAAAGDATLTSTEANVVPSTVSTLSSGAGDTNGQSTSIVVLDGTTTPVDLYLNFAMPDAGSTANDALIVNGTIEVTYILGMDN